jgi:hypothetical protein
MRKIIVSLLFAFGLATSAFAWDQIPGKPFGLSAVPKLSLDAPTSTIELVGMPSASLGFAVGPNAVPSYGYSGGWDIILSDVSSGSTPGTVNVVPYVGAGLSLYIDMGPWISSGFDSPVLADLGFNVLGPQIGGLVPSAEMVWNLQTGDKKTIVNLTAPLSIFQNVGTVRIL